VSFRAIARFANFAFDGGNQTVELALAEIVVGTGPHGRHGYVFLDDARYDDEGKVQAQPLQDRQRNHRRKTRHVVVRQHHVPGARCQRFPQRSFVFDPLRPDLVTRQSEAMQQQHRVVFGILDQQHIQRAWCSGCVHGVVVEHGGVNFRREFQVRRASVQRANGKAGWQSRESNP
jgi:hypothetical protein